MKKSFVIAAYTLVSFVAPFNKKSQEFSTYICAQLQNLGGDELATSGLA